MHNTLYHKIQLIQMHLLWRVLNRAHRHTFVKDLEVIIKLKPY